MNIYSARKISSRSYMSTVSDLIKVQVLSNENPYVKKFYLTIKECNAHDSSELEESIKKSCATLSPELGYRFHIETLNDCCYVKAIKIPPKGCQMYQCLKEKHHSAREV